MPGCSGQGEWSSSAHDYCYDPLTLTGAHLTDATLQSDSWGEATFCLAPGCYHVTVDGGDYQSEVSWEFAGYSGGASYDDTICVGDTATTPVEAVEPETIPS